MSTEVFRVGDRVQSLGPHAGYIIQCGDAGTVIGVRPSSNFKSDIVFVKWDAAHGNLKNCEEYGVSDFSAWSVYSYEIILIESASDEIESVNLDFLFESV